MVFFSTIIPVFNRANLIKKTLASIFAQEFSDQEVIVVDDGSTDETLQVLAEYGDCIKILRQKNQGPGAARNLGIQHAQGKYIVFLDSDDLWLPWTLSTYKEIIAKNGFPSFIAGTPVQFHKEDEVESIQPDPLTFEVFSDYFASSRQLLWLQPGAVAVRADVLRSVGGFTNAWINGEDCDLWTKLGTAEGFVRIQSPVIYAYRQHQNSAIANLDRSYQGMLYLIQQEQAGQYPGSQKRKQARREILSRHIRPVSLACLHEKYFQKAWQLYQKTLLWHISLKRVRYLLGFFLISIINFLRFRKHTY